MGSTKVMKVGELNEDTHRRKYQGSVKEER